MRVSEASRTGPEGGKSAWSPLGREGAADGLSKLIRSERGREGLPAPFLSSNSKSAFLCTASGAVKSYRCDPGVRRSFGTAEAIAVMGKGEGTSANRVMGFLKCGSSTALGISEGVLIGVGFVVGMLLSVGLSVSKSVKVYAVESGRLGLDSGAGFGGAVFAVAAAVCAGVSLLKATALARGVGLLTGGLGAGFLPSGMRGGEDTARGETGGLFLAFRAASLGECLRFGGIGVPDF